MACWISGGPPHPLLNTLVSSRSLSIYNRKKNYLLSEPYLLDNVPIEFTCPQERTGDCYSQINAVTPELVCRGRVPRWELMSVARGRRIGGRRGRGGS